MVMARSVKISIEDEALIFQLKLVMSRLAVHRTTVEAPFLCILKQRFAGLMALSILAEQHGEGVRYKPPREDAACASDSVLSFGLDELQMSQGLRSQLADTGHRCSSRC